MAVERGHYRSVRNNQRSSMRSKGSSSTNSDPKERVKDCCRKLVAFMCTQVGVGALIVCYALFGAFGFIAIETQNESLTLVAEVKVIRDETVKNLWDITEVWYEGNKQWWDHEVDIIMYEFQEKVVNATKHGYDGRTMEERWSYPAALMFCLSIFTMIGYGNLVPKSKWGKASTVIYAVIGIPLYILYFMNMGEILAQTFKWLYRKIYQCSENKVPEPKVHVPQKTTIVLPEDETLVIVPWSSCLWVMAGYIVIGTIMFAEWEKWNYLDSSYFCVTSLCKIGIGDFVPGTNILESQEGNQSKLVINFIYLLLGMGLVAMCYYLMKEEVLLKCRELKEDLIDLLHNLKCDCCCCCKELPRERPPNV